MVQGRTVKSVAATSTKLFQNHHAVPSAIRLWLAKSIIQYLLSLEDDGRFSKPENIDILLTSAAANGREDILEMLVNHYNTVDRLTAERYAIKAKLYNSVRYGKEELAKELLSSAGPDYDVQDDHYCSMLMYAAFNGL
jgi:hypothetical protein